MVGRSEKIVEIQNLAYDEQKKTSNKIHKEMYHMDERLFINEIGHKKCLIIV
jgi:hypothetical protein